MKEHRKVLKRRTGVKAKIQGYADGGEILIYKSPENPKQVEVRLEGDSIWLTQKQMAELFDKNRVTITEHIISIFKDNELNENSVCRNFRHTAEDGKTYETKHYNLDVIISVGYRVNSKRGTQFRIWATQRRKKCLKINCRRKFSSWKFMQLSGKTE